MKRLSSEFLVAIVALEEQICGEAGCKFTIGSPKQLGDILFDKLQMKGGRNATN